MAEECTHDCAGCAASGGCAEKNMPQKAALNEFSSVRHVIAVVSGKGGVGKSLVTAMLASKMQRMGYNSAVLDADITGPSIPKLFGIHERAAAMEYGLLPAKTKTGIEVMSLNLLLENESDPVIWRGPVIGGAAEQFWTDVIWSDIFYMFVDMPPGTGDVPLTVFQSLPVDGIIVVTSPQELVSMIVEKAVKMAGMMNVPVLGLVENMSYFKCPSCGKEHKIFGESHLEQIAKEFGIDTLARIPMDPSFAALCDKGMAEDIQNDCLDPVADMLVKKFGVR